MDVLILAVYSAIVWFVFIKKKWLPWNTTSQVTVVIIPIVGLAVMILFLNVVAPSTNDVRVIKYVINVVPQVKGRVIEVPVEPNRLYMAVGTYTQSWATNGAIIRSTDQGATWQRTDLPFKLGANEEGRSMGERLVIDPHKNNILFLGSRHDGLAHSWSTGPGRSG